MTNSQFSICNLQSAPSRGGQARRLNGRSPAPRASTFVALVAWIAVVAACNTPCWSADWQYLRQLTFSSATTRADSVIGITLSPQTLGNAYQHFNADGSDLRFTAADGATPLNYWIESWNPAGESKVWVKVPQAGTAAIKMKYGNPTAASASAGAQVFNFFDDFNNGLWTKNASNPVITSAGVWESGICEPSVLYENNTFKMWYMGSLKPGVGGKNAALGYATSPDGLNWTATTSPVLQDPNQTIIRTTVVKNQGTYYLFASDYNFEPLPTTLGNLWRWTSTDGLNWQNKTKVLNPTLSWESPIENVGIAIDGNTWHMLYQCEGGGGKSCAMGSATSTNNGQTWTKNPTPVIGGSGTGFYGGDPALIKAGDTYFTWHSQAAGGDLRLYCQKSTDMVHWQYVGGGGPQIGYTQPWERGINRPEVWWNKHLTDADLMEHDGKVWLYYSGAQSPLGVAWFDGTMAQLADRLKNNDVPLKQWAGSEYGMVENNQLKISDNGTMDHPFHESAKFSDQQGYTVRCKTQSYFSYTSRPAPPDWHGSPIQCISYDHPQTAVVMRYRDDANMARFRLVDNQTTYYEERIGGVWSTTVNIGANNACDDLWHQWQIDVNGDMNRLYIDGLLIGSHASGAALCNLTNLQVGFSTQDAFVAFDDVRVTGIGLANLGITIGAEVPEPSGVTLGVAGATAFLAFAFWKTRK
jgi:hypothetical protein